MKSQHQRELGRELRNFNYERSGLGLFFPRQGLMISGVFEVENLTRGGKSIAANLVVDQGLDYVAGVVLGSTSKISTWYIAPFAGNATPAANWTAANFDSNSTEFTSYTAATRPTFSPGSVASGTIGNLSDRAEITVNDGGQTTIYGVGILSASGKEATTGTLFSAARLASPRTGIQEDDVIALGYSLQATDAS